MSAADAQVAARLRLPAGGREAGFALVEGDAEGAVGHGGGGQHGHRVPGDLGAFVWFGVVRVAQGRLSGGGLEEQADPEIGVAVAAVHGGGEVGLVLGELDADFLAGLPDHCVDGALTCGCR
jgi:hypothetical protein